MPFTAEFGLVFNCGFCRTAVYECLCRKSEKKSGKKKPEGRCSDQSTQPTNQSPDSTQTVEGAGETQEDKVCAQPDVKEHFKVLFSGPQFTVGNTYFEQVSSTAHTLFERHCQKVMNAFSMKFHSTSS